MYVYIYDSITGKKKYNKTLINIEKKITDLGLNGKIIRLEGISNAEKIIQDEIKYGAKTIVAIGNDKTFNIALNAIIKSSKENKEIPALGIIPLEEKNNALAGSLGIKSPLNACDTLLARRVEGVNVPRINEAFFLSQIQTTSPEMELDINKNYSIKITKNSQINIINFPLSKRTSKDPVSDPKDEVLELFISPIRRNKNNNINKSIFSLDKLTINKTSEPVLVDNCVQINSPAHITTTSNFVNLIVGKNRNF